MTAEPTIIQPRGEACGVFIHAIPRSLVCAACFGPLDWVLEPEKARQNPMRVKCQNTQCKNFGRVYRVPTVELVAE